jgi:hypothetical protein
MLQKSSTNEKNAFTHISTGKFEKTFEREEIVALYHHLKLVEEQRIEKQATFFGKTYDCYHHWMIFKKP